MNDDELKQQQKTPGQKASETKGPIERSREARMAAWTKKHGKDDAKNPHSKANIQRSSTSN